MDQVAAIHEKTVFTVDQVPGKLLHPKPVWRGGEPGDRIDDERVFPVVFRQS